MSFTFFNASNVSMQNVRIYTNYYPPPSQRHNRPPAQVLNPGSPQSDVSNTVPNDAGTLQSDNQTRPAEVSNTDTPRRRSRIHRRHNRPAPAVVEGSGFNTRGFGAWNFGWLWGDRDADSEESYSSDGSSGLDNSDGESPYRQPGRRGSVNMDNGMNRVRERMGHLGQRMERMGQRMELEGQRMERQTRTRTQQTSEMRINFGSNMTIDMNGITMSGDLSRSGPFNGFSSIIIDGPRSPRHARSSSTTTTNPVPEPKSQPPPKPVYTEKHETAASLIQQKFRIRQSLRAINSIVSEFRALKSAFVYPETVDFQMPGSEKGHITILLNRSPSEFDKAEGGTLVDANENQPKLAYTRANYAIYTYVNAMEKFLIKLDKLESWGDKGVGEKRSLVAKEVGKEWATLKRDWTLAYIEKKREEGKAAQAHLNANVEVGDDEWLDVGE